jgi:cytoskeletal protein RodZ
VEVAAVMGHRAAHITVFQEEDAMNLLKTLAFLCLVSLFVVACSENSSTPTSQVDDQKAPASDTASASAEKAASAVEEQAATTAEQVADTAQQAAAQVTDTISETADTAQQAAAQATDMASQAADTVQQAAAGTDGKPTEMIGTLMNTEDGLALVTEAGAYPLAGSDLTDLAGQRVKITGTLAEADAGTVLQVLSVLPAD